MDRFGEFKLPKWIEPNAAGTPVVLAGSLGPVMAIDELRKISRDPHATTEATKFDNLKLGGGGPEGIEELRKQVAALYDQDKVKITADDVIIANATTGANLIVLFGLLAPGDHVVSMYPTYGPLYEIARGIGAEVSYWKMDPNNGWKGSLDELKKLLRPSTKMLILNNPHNPTGSVLSTSELNEIIEIASEHNITVFEDEIFRPLFHGDEVPISLVEHKSYDNTIVTGSLSKTFGFSGVRIGWIVTRNKKLRDACLLMRSWTLETVSAIDEKIAAEILSERCKQPIIDKNIGFARENLKGLREFVKTHASVVSCAIPDGAATAFVKFSDPKTGKPVDDVEFCTVLKREAGVLLSPGSLCFGPVAEGDFRGFVRLHITAIPDNFKDGMARISSFLASDAFSALSIREKL